MWTGQLRSIIAIVCSLCYSSGYLNTIIYNIRNSRVDQPPPSIVYGNHRGYCPSSCYQLFIFDLGATASQGAHNKTGVDVGGVCTAGDADFVIHNHAFSIFIKPLAACRTTRGKCTRDESIQISNWRHFSRGVGIKALESRNWENYVLGELRKRISPSRHRLLSEGFLGYRCGRLFKVVRWNGRVFATCAGREGWKIESGSCMYIVMTMTKILIAFTMTELTASMPRRLQLICNRNSNSNSNRNSNSNSNRITVRLPVSGAFHHERVATRAHAYVIIGSRQLGQAVCRWSIMARSGTYDMTIPIAATTSAGPIDGMTAEIDSTAQMVPYTWRTGPRCLMARGTYPNSHIRPV